MSHPALLPFDLEATTLPNRLAVAPMSRVSAEEDGTPTAEIADYYARYAQGGFGIVISEGVYTDEAYSQGYLNQPGITTDRHVKAWGKISDAVRQAGAQPVMQLMHAGALSQGNRYGHSTAGPSAVRPLRAMMDAYGGSGPWPVPKAMTPKDIEHVLAGFVASALAARAAGFAGVEVHAANGYLLDQFLTPYTNTRTDEFGGSVTNRARLTASVIAAIRDAIPDPGFWVGVRLSQGKVNDHGYRWEQGAEEAALIFATVSDATYLHIAGEGSGWEEGALLDNGETITALARRVTQKPVIANGNLADADLAARVIGEGHADLISLGRGALANPDYPAKLARGMEPTAFDPAMLSPKVTLANTATWNARKVAASTA
ncbi:NADH:flavin oxidoreductase [Streptomyces sp. ME01-18a]|uniref:NADH:flavin oxidoreductase n=1 Tax=Streptomyces sp. ME01-18a TaxID=3028669 RepID=UPI0029B8FF83|nr:NADH:flavin oxidoreductase [Streptomyces sp. ME01-18a]MDX3434324.1 NADH:flavin oxidoreductase [Streptomyces sp. ME01-18a]